MSSTFVLVAVTLCLLAWLFVFRPKYGARSNLPPGPKPLPIIGNLLDMPRSKEWETFGKWKEQYGDVVFVRIFHRPIIILMSLEACSDLMVNRYLLYSDRPSFPMMDLIGHQWNFGFKPLGKEWSALRKLFSSKYSTSSALRMYHDSQRAALATLLQNLLRDPDHYLEHVTLRANQLIIDVTYGVNVTSASDQLIRTAENVMGMVSIALSPPMWIFNPVTLISQITTLFGGTDSIKRVQSWRQDLEDLRNVAFEKTKASMAEGRARPSFAGSLLQDLGTNPSKKDEDAIRDCAAVAYGAASETTISSGVSFMLAMILNPAVQKKAQEEIDRVVGPERLPNYSDRASLPYVTAVMKETLRFHAPAPSGVPHMLKADDEYRGYHMPAGSIVMINIEGLLHDPSIYPDPDAFKPERYLGTGEFENFETMDPSQISFGIGRRVCPGKNLSEESLWLMVAQCLAVFTFSPVDENSPPPLAFKPGAISRPAEFPCKIRPRSDLAKTLIETAI